MQSPLYAEIATKGLPDQVFLNRDPVGEGGGTVTPARRPRPALARDLGRGRKLRGLVALLARTAGASR